MPARLAVTPAAALIDVPRVFSLEGFHPHSAVTLTLTSRQPDGEVWRSRNTYLADAKGTVDVSGQAPVSGGYRIADGQGPIWSQSPAHAGDAGDTEDLPAPEGADGVIHVRASASDTHGNHASARFEQRHVDSGVTRQPLNEDGLVGVLYTPAGPGRIRPSWC
ncbi:acyl-CoA thioesterase/BAAT N-terminal domain-containing protein [Achromobacter sp. UBA4530]|uniref:acyl-CoA thioesterase/BAAT N-terminal domain-containing protein n=1 Tax=Achromobacter sp. UBA4530 TaxID=1945912 RepID=UPI0032E40A04